MTRPFDLLRRTRARRRRALLLAIAALLAPAVVRAGDGASSAPAPARAGHGATAAAQPRWNKPAPHRPATLPDRAKEYFRARWGIDALRVTRAASGSLIRFTYRVTDPAQAAPLTDRKVVPFLYAERTRAVLSVPVMDKIGSLRQVGTPSAGNELWVAFSNKGNLVKPGDKVDVVIGRFRAEGLIVQ